MNNSIIKELLEKYYSGETSLEDEAILRRYLLSEDVDEQFSADRMVFMALKDSSPEVPDSLTDDLSRIIDNLDDNSKQLKSKQHRKIQYLFRYAAAAVLVTVLAIGIFHEKRLPADTFSSNVEMTEEEAIAQFQKSMALLSDGFEKSYGTYNKADETIHNTLETLGSVLK